MDGLEQQAYAATERDTLDSRRLNVVLTPTGERYARAVVDVITSLNHELVLRVDPEQLTTATAVLQEVIAGGKETQLVGSTGFRQPERTPR